jgi:probable HAF family extracellular repeat protein
MVTVLTVALLRLQNAAAQGYTITDLGTLYPTDINNNGQIAGMGQNQGDQAVVYSIASGTSQDLGTLGGKWATAGGINNSGQVVGWSHVASGFMHAYLYSGSMMQDLGTLNGFSASTANGINASGEVVGGTYFNQGHAFLYSGGTLQELGTLGGNSSFATRINDSGKIIGFADTLSNVSHAFLYDGTMHDLGTLGGSSSQARGINNSNQIVGGAATLSGQSHAFLYDAGAMRDLGTLGGNTSYGAGINNNGQIVGASDISGASHAFLFDHGSMLDLNTLIPTNSGWTLQQALGINDLGQIIGVGISPNGPNRGFLLSPALQMLQMTSIGVQSNQFGFAVSGTGNQLVVVETCSNLTNPIWSAVATNTLTSSSFYFSDPYWTKDPVRFYRLRFP